MAQQAELYRMSSREHLCPFGLKSKDLLRREGFAVDDHLLRSREETDAFKRLHHVETTPQVFIDGQHIGGYDDLRERLGKKPEKQDGTTYAPVIAVFALGLAVAVAVAFATGNLLNIGQVAMWFVGTSMVLLALQKVRDLRSFSNQFITYDLLAMRRVRYAYVYPFLEAYAGLGMLAGLPAWAVSPIAIFIGILGAVSVIKAIYVDKRELKCACVGGDSNVPLGLVSLSENLMMLGAGIWMLALAV
jgi:glutaredoxin